MSQKKQYSEEDIKEIEWMSHIRMRPGMYIGGVNNRAIVEMLKGYFTNTITENQTSHIFLELKKGNKGKIRFKHLKTGLPDDWVTQHREPQMPFYLDLIVLNALSNTFSVQFYGKNGESLELQTFKKGKIVEGSIKNRILDCRYVDIGFQLDPEIWTDSFTWNQDFILNELQAFAFLHKRCKFEIKYYVEEEPCKVIYHYKNGLQDRIALEKHQGLGGSYFETSIDHEFEDFTLEAAFAFREYSVDKPFLKSFVNAYYTHENGSHVAGLLKGLTHGVMKYFQKHELTHDYKISEKGIKESLIACVNIKMRNPEFSGCVKNKLASPEVIKPIADYVAQLLFTQIEENEESAKKLIRKFKI